MIELLPDYGAAVYLPGESAGTAPKAVDFTDRSRNPLRPRFLDEMIGQPNLRAMLRRLVDSARAGERPLSHMLLVAASGTGKSTVAGVVANELGVNVYQVEAPISHDTLLELREVMQDRDVLFIDEVHQQAIMERRGRSSSTQPEVLFNIMEDRTIVTGTGVLPFPKITVIAATTDEGMLPDPFVMRFPLRPVIEPYIEDDLITLVFANAIALGHGEVTIGAAEMFARASRLLPRVLNNYVRNAVDLSLGHEIDEAVAEEVLYDLNGVTDDGLTRDMQSVLTFMFTRAGRTNADGDIVYQASVATLATAIGKSRDQKAVQLRIEPYLIERGYLQVGHGGRRLTDAGVKRAKGLLNA